MKMTPIDETRISKAILDAYHRKLTDHLAGDVLIAGAGPAGMIAAIILAGRGLKVTVLEKRLSTGGGVWGGGMGLNEAVVQTDALAILDECGVRHEPAGEALHTVDTIELAAGLSLKAVQAGAAVLNLISAEDVCLHDGRVTGVVVNRSMIAEALPVDPITFSADAVIDATGHDAALVTTLRRRGVSIEASGRWPCEGPMDAAAGETFVEQNVAEVYPGLWVAGMSVCAVLGGPRMGPIFGGMLLSGRRAAELIGEALARR